MTTPGDVAREPLERDERRAAHRRALVLEPAPEQLDLLAEAELADRPVGDRALAVVGVAGRGLDLVAPLGAELRQLLLGARLRERVGLRRRLGERQLTEARLRGAGPMYVADGRNSRPVRFCSRMCADQPATREQANIAGASGGGISAMSRTTAE